MPVTRYRDTQRVAATNFNESLGSDPLLKRSKTASASGDSESQALNVRNSFPPYIGCGYIYIFSQLKKYNVLLGCKPITYPVILLLKRIT